MVLTPNRSGLAGRTTLALAAIDAALIGLGLILTPTTISAYGYLSWRAEGQYVASNWAI